MKDFMLRGLQECRLFLSALEYAALFAVTPFLIAWLLFYMIADVTTIDLNRMLNIVLALGLLFFLISWRVLKGHERKLEETRERMSLEHEKDLVQRHFASKLEIIRTIRDQLDFQLNESRREDGSSLFKFLDHKEAQIVQAHERELEPIRKRLWELAEMR